MHTKKRNHRFFDGTRELCEQLTPITGFNEKPLVTLEEAIEPIVRFISDLQIQVSKAKNRVPKPIPDGLSIDESAAIILYTMEWELYTNSLYYILNEKLRLKDREQLKPWFLYLKLILTGLARLPRRKLTVYRGIILNDRTKYQVETDVMWWGFSSCTINQKLAENKHFLEHNSDNTLFIIDSINGIDISKHSYFGKEKEILLLPATTLKVTRAYSKKNGLYVIHLQEIESEYEFLESISIPPVIESPEISSESNSNSNSKLNKEINRLKNNSNAYLFQNHYNDNDMDLIVKNVLYMKQCQKLFLKGNQITSQAALILGKSLENNHLLEDLYITDIQMKDSGIQTLAQSLSDQKNTKLKVLCLNNNGITFQGAEYLSNMLKSNQSLTHLWLPNNNIGDRGIQFLAESLRKNPTLQVLSLEWNRFEQDNTIQSLNILMLENSTLTELKLDGRDLSRYDIKKLKETSRTKHGFSLKIE